MTTVSIFEHQTISLLGEDNPLQSIHLRQLDRLNHQAGVDLVRFGYRHLRATSYVGVIQLGGMTLQVLPKVDNFGRDDGRDEASVDSAVANLLWMLVYAGELPVHENEVAALLKQRADLFEILVRIFCERLLALLMRGLPRAYRHQEEILPVLKGRWLLSRQLRTEPIRRDRFLVAYDEFLVDTPLNRVLGYAVCFLLKLTRNARNRQRLAVLTTLLDEVPVQSRMTSQDLDRVVFTRLNHAYRPVFNLACMFLSQEALQLRTGQTQAFTFLFDMNTLFERFVAGFLHRHRTQALPEALRDCEVITQSRGVARWLARTDGDRNVFRLKPDLLLRHPDRTIALVVDTKYKTQRVIQEADAYQMNAYAGRYNCKDVLLLYPEARMTPQTLYIDSSLGERSVRLRTQTINLRHRLAVKADRERLALELSQALEGS